MYVHIVSRETIIARKEPRAARKYGGRMTKQPTPAGTQKARQERSQMDALKDLVWLHKLLIQGDPGLSDLRVKGPSSDHQTIP